MKWPGCKVILRLICIVCLLSFSQKVLADHLKGGWMKYSVVSSAGGYTTYEIVFYQYSDCSEPEKIDPSVAITVYDAATRALVLNNEVNKVSLTTESKSDFGPCFQNPPYVCYLIAEYRTTIKLADNSTGYVIASQRCCRITGIVNIENSSDVGLTYTVTIPGTPFQSNNSPVFKSNELVAICYNSPFDLDLSATDPDNDSLVYFLCDGYTGANKLNPKPSQASAPPYYPVSYTDKYSGVKPLGPNVSIDSSTGIISGTAPDEIGTYVIAVCVQEYRHGVYVSSSRKEIHVSVANCSLGATKLKPSYITCDGFSFQFNNEVPNKPEYSYNWDFGVTTTDTDTSTLQSPTYTYADTGVYTIKLKASNNLGCRDSATAQLSIFPGFTPDFAIDGSCIVNPYSFKDRTTTNYGVVNSWRWDFGDLSVFDDTSSVQNPPTYIYKDTGSKLVTLYTTNSKGCYGSVSKTLVVSKGPQVAMLFRDTLICIVDSLRLQSSSETAGVVFKWLPDYNIIGNNTATPVVYPKQSTLYNLEVSYKGCLANDSVLVNVVDHVDLKMDPDTLICLNDSLQLTPETNALYFSWTPSSNINSVTDEFPVVAPSSASTYALTASIGSCKAQGVTAVAVAPYPLANGGNDEQICSGTTVQLSANTDAENFSWSPTNTLLNSGSLTPVAGPISTTPYVLTVFNTSAGKCPKPVTDTVIVVVIPKVNAFAGNDTIVVINQPLQLNGSGGTYYEWTPSTYLNNPLIANPVATFTGGIDTITYTMKAVTEAGCSGYDKITVHAFETIPQIFVPTGFTPNNDGNNDVMRPTVAGMKQFIGFSVYNRWGELLFTTARQGEGWDGTFKGEKQPSGTYVFAAYALDYQNKRYEKKGTFVLIR